MKQKPTVESLRAKIEQAKRKLIREANTKGIVENFGDKERRGIEDMALQITHDPANRADMRIDAGNMAVEFADWVAGYTG